MYVKTTTIALFTVGRLARRPTVYVCFSNNGLPTMSWKMVFLFIYRIMWKTFLSYKIHIKQIPTKSLLLGALQGAQKGPRGALQGAPLELVFHTSIQYCTWLFPVLFASVTQTKTKGSNKALPTSTI